MGGKKTGMPAGAFLPTTREEMDRLGWDCVDVLLVTGDAYVDHPSFGAALIGRRLLSRGFRTGVIAQPRWDGSLDVEALGRPRLFAGITAGALDSMLAHYTAFRKKRRDDAYTPGGRAGARPNRACLVYTSLVRHAFPGLPVVLGGIEASLRRAAHYDFWLDKIRRSILLDSKADLVVYGMGERAVLEIAKRLLLQRKKSGEGPIKPDVTMLQGIPGTAYVRRKISADGPDFSEDASVRLPSYEEILADGKKLVEAALALERQVRQGLWAVQRSGDVEVVFAPPADPLSTPELDALYRLPFTRRAHPSYGDEVPAAKMIQFSITTHRGCGGGCSFCSLAIHQGRRISSRSRRSILLEAESLCAHPDFRGGITDVGGPSANMWGARCLADPSACKRESCLVPSICPSFQVSQSAQIDLLKSLSALPGVTSVRVASGVRHDLALADVEYVRALCRDFVGGQLKLAPEHISDHVLGLMRKPGFKKFESFLAQFEKSSRQAGKEQYIVPYLISAFPGCRDEDMLALALWFSKKGWKPRQVQCFIPTPGTVATAMYYAGVDTRGRSIDVARTDGDRLRQHRILQPAEPGGDAAGARPGGRGGKGRGRGPYGDKSR